MKNDGTAQIRH